MSTQVATPEVQEIDLPVAPVRTKRSRSFVVAIAAFVLASFIAGFALVQTANLNATSRDLDSTRATLDTTRTTLTQTQEDLDLAEGAVDSLESEVAEQDARLVSCEQANTISVKMDGLQHDLLTNALTFGSMAEWNSLYDRYEAQGEQWRTAANACTDTNRFTFD